MIHRIRIIILILAMIMPTLMCAQLQSPLGTGISWSRQVWQDELENFPTTNELQIYHDSHPGCPDIKRIFKSLFDNYRIYVAYNDSIFMPTFRDDWAELIRYRASLQSQMYVQNQRDIDSIMHFFKDVKDVPDCAYDAMLRSIHHLYRVGNNDFFLMEQFMDILLPHYEARPTDYDRLLQCYIMMGYYQFQFSRIDGDKEHAQRAIDYFRKAISLTDDFSKFISKVSPYYLLSAYRNVMVSFAMSGDVTIAEAYKLHLDLESLYRRNKQMFVELPNLLDYLKWTMRLFDLKAPYICIENGDTKSRIFNILYSNYLRHIGKSPDTQFENEQFTYDSDLWIDYLYIQSSVGKITPDDAFEMSRNYITRKLDREYESNFTNINNGITYIYNTFATSLRILERASLPFDVKHDLLLKYMSIISQVMSNYPKARDTNERVDAERRIITMPYIQQYLTTKEREELLKMLIIIEQPQTFAHVSMVARMCDAILNAVIDYKPDLLRDIPGCATRIDVWKNADSLKTFFHNAAIYHDLGKNLIPSIVSNNFRRLTDHEFSYIKLHPENARIFLSIDPSLSKYEDICFGHHKWYNGKGGYPAWFDNTKSPLRILIDILTICDCTDAATDNFGRNYHNYKMFKQVLAEFDRDAGTRYNPELIQLIHDNPSLREELANIVDEKRMDSYYNIYRQYFR